MNIRGRVIGYMGDGHMGTWVMGNIAIIMHRSR